MTNKTDAAVLDPDTMLADDMPLEVRLRINPQAAQAIADHYKGKVSPNPVSSPEVGIPTLDQLRERASQGMGAPEPAAMMAGVGTQLGRENVQYTGFESAKFVAAWRSIDGMMTKVPLMFLRGRKGHDWGAKYFSKLYGYNDPSIPEVLWGQPKLLPRPPVSPPYPIMEIPEKCDFCPKAGFPNQMERRRHMEKKHKAEFGAVRETEDRDERRRYNDAILQMAQSNSALIQSIIAGGGRSIPTDMQLHEIPLAPSDDAEPQTTGAPESDAQGPLLGKFWPIKEAAKYYRLSRNAMEIKVKGGLVTAYKEGRQWKVFVPSVVWVPPEGKARGYPR